MTGPTPRLLLIGGGRMGEALLTGLLANGWAEAGDITVVETAPARQVELRAAFPDLVVAAEPVAADGAVLAVKPAQVATAARALGAAGGAAHVLSIAAGITTAAIEAELPAGTPVVRAMPNTPALVGAGAAAIAGGAAAGDDDLAWAEGLLATVGTVVRVAEPALDLVTGLSGSGPAYVFLVAEALIDAGVLVGLPRDTATGWRCRRCSGRPGSSPSPTTTPQRSAPTSPHPAAPPRQGCTCWSRPASAPRSSTPSPRRSNGPASSAAPDALRVGQAAQSTSERSVRSV